MKVQIVFFISISLLNLVHPKKTQTQKQLNLKNEVYLLDIVDISFAFEVAISVSEPPKEFHQVFSF